MLFYKIIGTQNSKNSTASPDRSQVTADEMRLIMASLFTTVVQINNLFASIFLEYIYRMWPEQMLYNYFPTRYGR